MADQLRYFDRGQILLKGKAIAELEDGSITITNGASDVVTLAGYQGVAKGPKMGTITARRTVPRAGFSDQDMHDAVLNATFLQVQAVTGGKRYTVTGVSKEIARSFGTQAAATENFSVNGQIEVVDL